MPLPIILGVGAAIAGIAGVTSGIHGATKMKEASDTMESAEFRHKKNVDRFEKQSNITRIDMDNLGKRELRILESFENFTNMFEKIHGKSEFKDYKNENVDILKYTTEELKQASIGAAILLGGIGGAAVGTAGGFAAAGATTAAVMALGTASTGTTIASLSGVAATNATLAAIGGGSLAAGGGGIALGTTLLSAATLGVGLLVGGVVFSLTASSLSNKADEAWSQMKKAEEEINKICEYLMRLSEIAKEFDKIISVVEKVYMKFLNKMTNIVEINKKVYWNTFTDEEKLIVENTVLLVNLLFNMCKVQVVLPSENATESNTINTEEINKSIANAKKILDEKDLVFIV